NGRRTGEHFGGSQNSIRHGGGRGRGSDATPGPSGGRGETPPGQTVDESPTGLAQPAPQRGGRPPELGCRTRGREPRPAAPPEGGPQSDGEFRDLLVDGVEQGDPRRVGDRAGRFHHGTRGFPPAPPGRGPVYIRADSICRRVKPGGEGRATHD